MSIEQQAMESNCGLRIADCGLLPIGDCGFRIARRRAPDRTCVSKTHGRNSVRFRIRHSSENLQSKIRNRSKIRSPQSAIRNGFTLVELLIAIAIIATLIGVLLPSLGAARKSVKAAVCASNLRQLATANLGYATDNGDAFVPAATDIWDTGGGRFRWHGVRASATGDPAGTRFDPALGPLAGFLGDGRIKSCPAFAEFRSGSGTNAYELGSGGYGYSQMYVGSRYWKDGYFYQSPGRLVGALTTEIQQPATKVMFADVAMPQSDGTATWLTEESFCSPPHFLGDDGRPMPDWGLATPDIHFRHASRAQVAWCDGHVEGRKMDFTLTTPNVYGADSAAADVGWFGPPDNSMFCVKSR